MTRQTQLLITVITWIALLVLYGLNRYLIKDRLLEDSSKVYLSSESNPETKPPGTLLSKIGVLYVFAVNIITFALLFIGSLSSPLDRYLTLVKVNLPLWVNVIGSILFVIDNIWGFFALLFNPNYTPLYKVPPNQFILATKGPYGIIRHPRYASEAFLNITLFLFTGIWLPLLGWIGWVAIYHQARAEENYLMALAAKEYGEYRKKTNMFFPKLRRKPTVE